MTTSYCDFISNSVVNACLHQTFLSRKNFDNTKSLKGLGAKQCRASSRSHAKIAATDLAKFQPSNPAAGSGGSPEPLGRLRSIALPHIVSSGSAKGLGVD